MPKIPCLVIYYDGNEYQAKKVETEFPNSAQPHIFGLDSESSVVAVIAAEEELGSGRHLDFTNDVTVYIDEVEYDLD